MPYAEIPSKAVQAEAWEKTSRTNTFGKTWTKDRKKKSFHTALQRKAKP